MADDDNAVEQAASIPPEINPLSPTEAMEKAKEATLRYKRNHGTLIQYRQTLELKKARYANIIKELKELTEYKQQLDVEIPALEKAIVKLDDWCATHTDMPEDIRNAEALAQRIKRLQKEIEIRKHEVSRLEAGLPSTSGS